MLIITNVINEHNWAFQIKPQLNYLRLTNLWINQDSIYINYEHIIDSILALFGQQKWTEKGGPKPVLDQKVTPTYFVHPAQMSYISYRAI